MRVAGAAHGGACLMCTRGEGAGEKPDARLGVWCRLAQGRLLSAGGGADGREQYGALRMACAFLAFLPPRAEYPQSMRALGARMPSTSDAKTDDGIGQRTGAY